MVLKLYSISNVFNFINKKYLTMNFHTPLRKICSRISQNTGNLTLMNKNLSTKTKVNAVCDKAVNDAEKIVGYPTSFLSLRWLLNDEVANVALHIKSLIGTDHPLLNTARDLILNKQSPALGLIVLLVSKAGGLSKDFSQINCDVTSGVLQSQRMLAEITEMIHTSNVLHKSILNISPIDRDYKDLCFGNKLSLLTGDYLLSSSFRELAGLKCHEVNALISTCLRDLVEAEFIEPRDKQNRPLPAIPLAEQKEIFVPNHFDEDVLKISEVLGNAKAEWTLRHLLGGASLLAKCCQCTLILAEHQEFLQKQGYLFGRNMALALQANKDLSLFKPGQTGPFSLVCAPLMFHIQNDSKYYKELMENIENNTVNYERIRKIVRSGAGLNKTADLQVEFSTNALNALNQFPETEAKLALVNILKSM